MTGVPLYVAGAGLISLVAGTSALAQSSCSVLAGGQTAVVMGLAAGAGGNLCMTTSAGRECRTMRADMSGVIVATSRAQLVGPIWMEPSAPQNAAPPPPCGFVVPPRADESKPLYISLLTAFAAFLTGMSAALIPRWLERRQKSREAASVWVGEYLTRLAEFERTGGADPEPRALPLMSRRQAVHLSDIATQAGEILAKAGFLGALGERDRRELVAPITSALRAYPSRPAQTASLS